MNDKLDSAAATEQASIGDRIDPILNHLAAEGTDFDKTKIRDLFISLWKFEDADKLSPEDQFLTTIGLFIYTSHNILDEYNIRIDRVRKAITNALEAWQKPELEKMVAEERAAADPFKAFVDSNLPKVDATYTWEHFQLAHKQADEKQWTYKMKRCWFAEFFIRFGRVDYIETACMFDQIPWNNRKDYVDLKLNNMFRKLGTVCQFNYKPIKTEKKDS
jgi:L-2-amino-thiazoline-4-carboxylic acid hydrolase